MTLKAQVTASSPRYEILIPYRSPPPLPVRALANDQVEVASGGENTTDGTDAEAKEPKQERRARTKEEKQLQG